MTSVASPIKELSEKNVELIGKLVSDIRNGKLQGPLKIALATISLLEQLISETQNASAFELCGMVRAVGFRIVQALPNEIVAGNMVRRVLRAIRDENRAQANQGVEVAGESLQRLVLAAPSRRATVGPAEQDLREPIRDQIAELRGEAEGTVCGISAQARAHIDGGEAVLAAGGRCALLEAFLRAAAAHARYRLVLAEGDHARESHAMAARLSQTGINVTVIANSAVFAVMSRVNKVVITVRAAIGGGAVLAPVGSHLLTTAAKHYNVPVLALAPLYCLVPMHGADHQWLTAFACTSDKHDYHGVECAVAHVYAPQHDFLLPDMITLFITNLGGSSPSYIYRLLSELYDERDRDLS